MKPFIFAFKEYPKDMVQATEALIKYDSQYNLNIDMATGRPAIEQLTLGTETFTKSNNEGSDSDQGGLSMHMATETRTFTKSEVSDSDADRTHIMAMMGTMTATRTMMESSDMDRA